MWIPYLPQMSKVGAHFIESLGSRAVGLIFPYTGSCDEGKKKEKEEKKKKRREYELYVKGTAPIHAILSSR